MNDIETAGGEMPPAQNSLAFKSAFGFSHSEVHADQITAYVGVWHDPTNKPYLGADFPGGGYGITWAGRGSEGVMYGMGTTYGAVPMLAYAGQRLLRRFTDGRLHVYTIQELEAYIGADGHVRKARSRNGNNWQGDPMPAFELLDPLVTAMDAGKWTLRSIPSKLRVQPYLFALNVMGKKSREALAAFKNNHGSPFPNGRPRYRIILER